MSSIFSDSDSAARCHVFHAHDDDQLSAAATDGITMLRPQVPDAIGAGVNMTATTADQPTTVCSISGPASVGSDITTEVVLPPSAEVGDDDVDGLLQRTKLERAVTKASAR
jgi:hypothetical protein